MGLYFNPPQVVQAAVHAPIAAQGQPPPPYRPIAAFMVAATLSWTPPPAPAQGSREIAPLIPAAAVSPPTPVSRTLALSIRAIWDQQPAWSAQSEPFAAGIAYVAPAVSNPPPRSAAAIARTIADAWNDYSVTVITVPQTAQPSSGDNPPPYSIVVRTSIRAIWDAQAAWGAQSEPDGAAAVAFVPPVVNNPPGYSTVTQAIIRSIWDQQPAWAAQSEPDGAAIGYVAPTVNNPPPRSLINQIAIRASWDVTPWSSQSETDNAGWNFSPPAVQNPPPGGPHPTAAQLASAWSVSWVSQRAAPVAGFIPPPTTVIARIIVMPNADRSVTPNADRILIVYAPRTVS
jgi:hypothetical protein